MTKPTEGKALSWKNLPITTLVEAGIAEERGVVRIPYYTADGDFYTWRVVADNRRWWSPGRPVIPYGLERLADLVDQNPIGFWVEGETDLLALRAWATALDNRPVVGLSAPGAGTWQPAWRRYMRSFTTIYAVGDGDDVGRRFNARIVEAVPWGRPIWLDDGEDVRSVLQSAASQPLPRSGGGGRRCCVEVRRTDGCLDTR